MKKYFITGIDTGVGKTIISAIFVEAFKADYWKPVQTGDFLSSDTKTVRSLVSNTETKFHSEIYSFPKPMSPHAAAASEGVPIEIERFVLPETKNILIIEGAGGVLVPLNDKYFIIDLIKKFEAEVILVSENYLGSINHTLLTVEALKKRNIPIKGIVFSGVNESSEQFILKYTGLKCLLRKKVEAVLNKDVILKYSKLVQETTI
jgi:dethiobiotin synthetase